MESEVLIQTLRQIDGTQSMSAGSGGDAGTAGVERGRCWKRESRMEGSGASWRISQRAHDTRVWCRKVRTDVNYKWNSGHRRGAKHEAS